MRILFKLARQSVDDGGGNGEPGFERGKSLIGDRAGYFLAADENQNAMRVATVTSAAIEAEHIARARWP
jgi:hypothetical protein